MSGKLFISDWEALSGGNLTKTFTLPIESVTYAHWHAGVEFADDDAGTTIGTPTGGTSLYSVKLTVLPETWQTIAANNNGTAGTIAYATSDESVDWAGPTVAVRVTMTSIAGTNVDYARIRVHTFES